MIPTKTLREASCADDYDPNSMPVEKAREVIARFLTPVTATERVHVRAALGRVLSNPWIDIADVARVVRPDVAGRSLDEWMDALGVRCALRHQAAADTLATAELLLKLWPQVLAQRQGDDWRALARLASQRRWLPG